ncbi:hypothetical protein F3Y22_tig00008146pilonHSYRG00171 [Hibiscus syriacus]|uniref:Uncharacterized protein n=1 Tax=Hibiscus syriacus TaxID=106335 RepID=A0A6A3C9B4_HIBSY|nr:hypothetical protein F3Y22_tig00008146pilonHSYRG00171 [Hibiscus syriacus]
MEATTSTTTTTNCSYFFNLRSNNVQPSSPSAHGSQPAAAGSGCGKLDGVVMWLINGVSTVFFASLDRCFCIRIVTADDGEEANDVPLIRSDGSVRRGYRTSSRRRGKGEKGAATFIQE